jgi:MFS transporter, DHA1 family, tetracycline resistance protein
MFKQIKGNARACMIVEPLFIIPYSLFVTYASVFMLKQGITETQIGLITSIGLVVQIFASFISGFLTDRLGRKNALLIFDVLSWSVGTLLWAISSNFWFFLIAAVINGFQKIPHIAWTCLLVEDTEPNKRPYVYTVLQFIVVVGGLFAPIGGLIVNYFSLIPAVRIMYILAFICMTTQFILRHIMTHETELGIRRKQETQQMNIKHTLKSYFETISSMKGNTSLIIIFIVYILFQFQLVLQSTYLSVYLVDVLRFSDSTIAIFPAISSVCMLFVLVFVVPKFREENHTTYMVSGFIFSILALSILLMANPNSLIMVIISTILSAVGLLFSNPYLEAAVANSLEDDNRANMFSILQVIMLIFISPAGIIGGLAYKLNPQIPFVVMLCTFIINIILLLTFSKGSTNHVSREEVIS